MQKSQEKILCLFPLGLYFKSVTDVSGCHKSDTGCERVQKEIRAIGSSKYTTSMYGFAKRFRNFIPNNEVWKNGATDHAKQSVQLYNDGSKLNSWKWNFFGIDWNSLVWRAIVSSFRRRCWQHRLERKISTSETLHYFIYDLHIIWVPGAECGSG